MERRILQQMRYESGMFPIWITCMKTGIWM